MFLLVSILKLPIVSFLGTLQRPTLLLIFSNFVVNTIKRLPKIDALLFFTLCYSIFVLLLSVTLYNPINALRSFANFMILIAFVSILLRLNYSKRLLNLGLVIQSIVLFLDIVMFENGFGVLFAGIFAEETKYFPSGLTPEPSDTAVLNFLFLLMLIKQRRILSMLVIFILGATYAIYLSVETYYFLIATLPVGIIFAKFVKSKKVLLLLSASIYITLTYFQFIFFPVTIFNDSAHNRLTTPTYIMHTAFDDYKVVFGNGFGSLSNDLKGILNNGQSKFDTGLSSEQEKYLNSDQKLGNPSVFNYYSRIIYELGFVGLFLVCLWIARIIKANDYVFPAMSLWFLSDIGPNILFLAL